jgi:hypothetical protein
MNTKIKIYILIVLIFSLTQVVYAESCFIDADCIGAADICCNGECKDQVDPDNCGGCGNVPEQGDNVCNPGDSCCGDYCSNLETDRYNCGSCWYDCVGVLIEQYEGIREVDALDVACCGAESCQLIHTLERCGGCDHSCLSEDPNNNYNFCCQDTVTPLIPDQPNPPIWYCSNLGDTGSCGTPCNQCADGEKCLFGTTCGTPYAFLSSWTSSQTSTQSVFNMLRQTNWN